MAFAVKIKRQQHTGARCSKAPGALQALIAGDEPDMIFTDAPYNVSIAEVSGRGRIKHPEFAEASGEMSSGQYVTSLKDTLGPAVSACRDGAILFTSIDWRHYPEMIEACRGHCQPKCTAR